MGDIMGVILDAGSSVKRNQGATNQVADILLNRRRATQQIGTDTNTINGGTIRV